MLSTDPDGVYDAAEWFFSRSYKTKFVSKESRTKSSSMFTHSKGINVFLARNDLHALQAGKEIQLLPDLGCITLHAQCEEARGVTTSEGEQADAFVLELRGFNRGQQ